MKRILLLLLLISITFYGCTTHHNYSYPSDTKESQRAYHPNGPKGDHLQPYIPGLKGVAGATTTTNPIPNNFNDSFIEKALLKVLNWCINLRCGDSSVLEKYSTNKNRSSKNIYFHTYRKITDLQQEPKIDYGLYTYVFVNRVFGEENLELRKKSKTIFNIIMENINESSSRKVQLNPEKVNLFLIPYKEKSKTKNNFNIDDYNHSLSIRASMIISGKYKNGILRKKLSQEGPFLVTTRKPIHLIDSNDIEMIIIDFSNTEPAATKEIMLTYMERLTSKGHGTKDFSAIEMIKADVLSKLIKFNASIELISESIAGD